METPGVQTKDAWEMSAFLNKIATRGKVGSPFARTV